MVQYVTYLVENRQRGDIPEQLRNGSYLKIDVGDRREGDAQHSDEWRLAHQLRESDPDCPFDCQAIQVHIDRESLDEPCANLEFHVVGWHVLKVY